MSIAIRSAVKVLVVLAAACAVILAVVWPWPAPAVDWRTPLDAALAQNDCKRAAAILYAASTAGSIEAFQKRTELTQRNICTSAWEGAPDRTEALQFFRKAGANATIDWLYRVDEKGLGAWRTAYVRAAIVLCVVPYDSKYRTDFVALSTTLPDDGGWVMAFHRQRRNACAALLEHVATQLVDDGDSPAKDAAEAILLAGPLDGSAHADFLSVKLFLEREREPVWDDDRDDKLADIYRAVELRKLKNAARAGHPEAIRLLITVLHEGRLGDQDDKQAYYWILRARRFGHPENPIASEIEPTLTHADRENITRSEELDWRQAG